MLRLSWLLALGVLSVAAGCRSEPAPRFRIAELAPQRLSDGRIEVRVSIDNADGPQRSALCARLEWLSNATPSTLVEAREQCTDRHLGGGESVDLVFDMASVRPGTGEKLVASVLYGGGQFVDPASTLTTEVPR
jgi:hypothetical protein